MTARILKIRVVDADFAQHAFHLILAAGGEDKLRNVAFYLVFWEEHVHARVRAGGGTRNDELPPPLAGHDNQRNVGADGCVGQVKAPSAAENVPTSGVPDGSRPGTGEVTSEVNGATVSFGMSTVTFGIGSTPLGAYTVPAMVVLGPAGRGLRGHGGSKAERQEQEAGPERKQADRGWSWAVK